MVAELLMWRDDGIAGVLSERRGRLSLSYERHARPISMSMPVRTSAYGDRTVRPWFRGLLPEGQIRLTIAYDIGVDPDDDFGLLRVLGKDCAGALALRPDGDPPNHDQIGPLLTEPEIGGLLRSLPTSPMGFERGFRVSLPGNQHKLLLTRTQQGWHRPDGVPSTHILKPAIVGLGDTTVENEAYCQWLASASGLPAAHSQIAAFDGVKVLLSERYDRSASQDSVRRVHQEDGCQALSIDPRHKYQTPTSGPSLRSIAKTLSDNGGDISDLLRLATFTIAIGNADWHGKNVSFTFADDDSIAVAPVYDAMSTRFYESSATGQRVERSLGMYIGGEADIDTVGFEHLVREGRSWGMSSGRATQLVGETVDSVRAGLDVVEPPVEQLRDLIVARTERLATTRPRSSG